MWIKFVTKTEFFTRLWYWFRIEHMTTPKVGRFTNISPIGFLLFWYAKRIIKYSLLTQDVPKINLIKISHSQVNIVIIFITFESEELQCWCRHNDENAGHSNEKQRWARLNKFHLNYEFCVPIKAQRVTLKNNDVVERHGTWRRLHQVIIPCILYLMIKWLIITVFIRLIFYDL